MTTNLSKHFEKRRLARGLKPGQVATLAGCSNVSKNGNRIRQFELSGDISQELFEKLAKALDVDSETIQQLVEQDRREFLVKWLEWVNEPIRPYLVIRAMAAIYSQCSVPAEINTQDEAEQWAGQQAKKMRKRCCLVWSRKLSIWFDHQGEIITRTEATPDGEPNVPWMQIGGRRFHFGDILRSVKTVDCPKK